jgi:hypothetical protein
MLSHIVSDIHEHYVTEILKPQLGKPGAAKPTSSSDLDGDGNVDSFEKKVRQFVYDVRHLVRKNNIPVEKAFQMRSAKTNYGAAVVKTAKEKLGIKSGGTAPVSEEVDGEKLYSIVIRYKNGTTYRKRASRSEINRLRSNPNVSSVEMTKYGVDGLAKKDYDGDGKIESPSKEHAGAVHNAIQRATGGTPDGKDTRGKTSKKKLKSHGLGEGFSNWRGDLCEIDGEIENKKQTQIKEKKVKNKIVINPPLNLETHIQNLGGELINITENIISDYNEIDIFSELNEHEISFLNDNLIDKILEEVFYEFIEEGYDIDEIVDILTENIDINVDILNEAKVTYGHDTENETKTDRLGKVKSGIKRIGKALARGAGYVSGAAVRGAKSAAKEFGSAYEKGRKRSSDTESSDSESRTRTSRSTPGLLSRIGTKLKSGLKKVVGKTARTVSRGARNIARSVGEEVEISEKITADTDMGTAIRDFYGSDSPQLAGRTKEERREAAIAAVLTARRGGKKIGEAIVDQPTPADDKVREKQNAAIKKQQMQNMKTIQRKREQLERQKLKLQQQDKLPMHSDSYEPEGKLVDEAIAGLRPASERTKNTITPAQRKKQEQERKRKEELAHKARLVIAGITKTAKTGEVTQSKPKSDAPESNRKLKPGQKKDTLAVKADKIISSSYEPEGEVVDELTRFEKEKGKDFRTGKPSTPGGTWKNDPVMRHMNKVMGSARMGVQPRGKKKESGKKPPAAGEVGSGVSSPAQKVQGRRAAAERAREFVQNTRGT